jgi:hypothetical protein
MWVNSKLPRESWIATLTCTVLGATTDIKPVVGGPIWRAVICLNGSLFHASWGFFLCLHPFAIPLPSEGWCPTNLKAFRINLSRCISGQPWRMQEVDDFVAILISREEIIFGGFRAAEATQRHVYHCDSAVGINSVPSLHARVSLSPQEVT